MKSGWWLPAIIVLLLTAAGIRYMSSGGELPSFGGFGGDRDQSYQTISSGASVQPGVQPGVIDPSNPQNPGANNGNPGSDSNSKRPGQLW